MSTMKGLHPNAVSLYLNPTLTFFMIMDQVVCATSPSIFWHLEFFDWFLLFIFGVNAFAVQSLKYMALQYQEPAKLSHYQYMNSVYQLMFDVFLFNAVFSALQWWGLAFMFMTYFVVGVYSVIKMQRDDALKK